MANPVDPYAPITQPVVDATAAADPSVAIMRAAATDRARNLQAFQQKQALEAAQEERTKASAAKTMQGLDRQQLPNTMSTDAVQWDQPDVAGKPFAQLPGYAKQHFVDAYGDMGGTAIAQQWNQAQTAATGHPVGVVEAGPGQIVSSEVAPGVKVQSGKTVDPAADRLLRTQAARMGVTGLPADASQEEIQDAIAQAAQKQQASGEQKTSAAQDMAKQRVITQIQRQVQNNQQVRFYQGAKANYDSIAQNVAKPVRTGADDAFLMQAAATMEAPGRSPTGNDVKEFMRANGIRGNLDVLANRFDALINNSPEAQAKQGRILSDDLAKQIAAAAKNALETRRSSITESMTPFVNRLEDLGEDPYRHLPKSLVDDVYGTTQPQQPQIPAGAVTLLQQHPELAAQFETKYGPGSAAKYLTPPR